MTENNRYVPARVKTTDSPTVPHDGREILHGDQEDGKNLATLPEFKVASPVKLVPASQFTFEQLTDAYNQTRVDYIVPMPMNAARLRGYVHNYDVDMDASAVAVAGDQILGIVMLGVRPKHTWITRLGVLPVKRRCGAGQLLMEHLIEQSRRLKVDYVILEVIKGNTPAYRLFQKLDFRDVRELLVLRRPPGPPTMSIDPYTVWTLNYNQAVALLHERQSTPSWLDEIPSLENAGNLGALRVELETGDRGWLVYQNTVFQLGRLVLQTEVGDPHRVGLALIHALHTRYPAQDTHTENLPTDDPHWPALQMAGYLESFSRIEMRLDLSPAG
jgi:ribosomal protein S18 acetylase RimI-like enzyme